MYLPLFAGTPLHVSISIHRPLLLPLRDSLLVVGLGRQHFCHVRLQHLLHLFMVSICLHVRAFVVAALRIIPCGPLGRHIGIKHSAARTRTSSRAQPNPLKKRAASSTERVCPLILDARTHAHV
jgi:hypothetical protein